MIDTHCHLNIMIKKEPDISLPKNFNDTVSIIVSEAKANGVNTIINVGTSLIESDNCLTLAHAFENIYAVIGIHPTDLTSSWRKDLATMHQWLTHNKKEKIVGIGECGLDLFHKQTSLSLQQDAFKAHIELALENNLALVVHSRQAYEETLRTIEPYAKEIKKGVFHCFSYDNAFAQQAVAWNFMLGIGGTITYPKNDELRAVVVNTPLQHIVLETDAPFLPIQSMRGKTNHPQYISFIADEVAKLKNIPKEEVANQTTQNAYALFNLSYHATSF